MTLKTLAAAACISLAVGTSASAATLTLDANSVIIDNAPFNNTGPEDQLGTGNYALTAGGFFKDIPYAIFGFSGISSVDSAILTWSYIGPFSNSTATDITLYAGTDSDGVITNDDQFMGTAIDTSSYLAAVSKTFDVTAWVNSAFAVGEDFAIRLEVDADPNSFTGYLGGQFGTPSIEYQVSPLSAVPLPAGLPLLLAGLAGLAGLKRRKKIIA